jgi:hypothetical protein
VPIEGRSHLGLKRVTKLKNLEYANYQSRLNSFSAWPNTYMRSEELADAGFFYNERNNIVIWHHCGIGRGNWSPGEDPWNRHAISSPACCDIIEARGCEYSNNVTGQALYANSAEVSKKKRNLHHVPYV